MLDRYYTLLRIESCDSSARHCAPILCRT